jgi:hypothetical protein
LKVNDVVDVVVSVEEGSVKDSLQNYSETSLEDLQAKSVSFEELETFDGKFLIDGNEVRIALK